jgi:N-glycosidase YbiA
MIREFKGTNRFLSNFYPAPVVFDGETYPTVEHAYQAAKTLDADERRRVRDCPRAGDAKRMGRQVTMREDWDAVKIGVMRDLLRSKFERPYCRRMLIATGEQYLQEGNTWGDTFWGVDVKAGGGANHLGVLLMSIREEINAGH